MRRLCSRGPISPDGLSSSGVDTQYRDYCVPCVEDIAEVLYDGEQPLMSEAEVGELVRIERLLADTDQHVMYATVGPHPEQPLGLLPVYPFTLPASAAVTPPV